MADTIYGYTTTVNGEPPAASVTTVIRSRLLDDAIARYKIPPWPYQAAYDRIVVFSVPEDAASRETYVPGGLLVKPENRRVHDQAVTPRGIIVSAGLGARDVLYAHGIGLGHMVWVARLSPWRHEVDRDAEGRTIEFLFLRVGDIVGSETSLEQLREREVVVTRDKFGNHLLAWGSDNARPRFDPPSYVG